MPVYTDQLHRKVNIPDSPKSIISLVPSQTELLYDLGLEEEVIGITKFCIHPERWFRTRARVGGTKTIHLDKVKELQPDLIIANKEENVKDQIEALAKEFPVWITDVNNLQEALAMIEDIGLITNRRQQGKDLSSRIKEGFSHLNRQISNSKLRTCYLIWKDPYMTIGKNTFIHNILTQAGFHNVFATHQRYPEITISELQTLNCELLLLSSEPYPFQQKHIEALQAQLPRTKILLVDGEAFSWYGSRLLHSPNYLLHLQQEITTIS